jgi:hypothetical protein
MATNSASRQKEQAMSQTAIEAANEAWNDANFHAPQYPAREAFVAGYAAALSALHAKAGVSVTGDADRSDIAGLKIALEQAWESNREREERIKSLDHALRNFTDGRDISYVDALEEARKIVGDLS